MEKYNDFGITYQNLLTGRKCIFTSSLSYLVMSLNENMSEIATLNFRILMVYLMG